MDSRIVAAICGVSMKNPSVAIQDFVDLYLPGGPSGNTSTLNTTDESLGHETFRALNHHHGFRIDADVKLHHAFN